MSKMIINHEVDLEVLKNVIEGATDLNDNNEMFKSLTQITNAKKELKDILDELEKYEVGAKNLITQKARQLYGKDWQTITGQGYKITRSSTGNIYVRNPDLPVSKRFIELKESLLTKVIDAELEKTGKLPKGIELNPSRGESIRITIK